MHPLVFVDTNILLDFYRARGKEAGIGLLKYIDQNHSSIITTCQVEMEFKKNRQSVILDALQSFKEPNWGGILQVPAFLQEAQPVRMISKSKNAIAQQAKKIRKRIDRVLINPALEDPVFQATQRLFKANLSHHLTLSHPEYRQIQRKALRRFLAGYPPRKSSDTFYGDALNWEWILYCAQSTGRGIVIVSRDSDYGVATRHGMALNDWLRLEFKQQVSQRRSIDLTDRFTEGLKRAGIKVTKEEEAEERRELDEWKQLRTVLSPSYPPLATVLQNLLVQHKEALDSAQRAAAIRVWSALSSATPPPGDAPGGGGKKEST
jgi:hypothetical protein